MRLKFTLSLLLLNIGLFASIYFLEKKDPMRDAPVAYGVLEYPISDIHRIEISGPALEEPKTLVKQSNNHWLLTSPITWPSNLFAVQRILNQLQFLQPEVSFSLDEIQASGQSLADFGLVTPNLTISVFDKSNNQSLKHTLHIGNPTQLGNRVYILNPDSKRILVVKQSLLDSLALSLDEIRSQQIFSIPLFDLNALNVQILAPHNLKIRLSKFNETWNFESPIQAVANTTLVNNSITQLGLLNVNRFVDRNSTPDSTHGLLAPTMRITLQGNTAKQTLMVGNLDKSDTSGEFYFAQLEGNPTLFTIPSLPIAALKDAQEALREKRLLSVSPDSLSNIMISDASNTANLQKLENGTWKVVTFNNNGLLSPLPADDASVSSLVRILTHLEAIDFVSDAPSSNDLKTMGLSSPSKTIKLQGATTQTLLLGNMDPATLTLFAKLEASPFVYRIHPSLLELADSNFNAYRSRIIDTLPKQAQIQSIQITNLSDNSLVFDRSINIANDSWHNALSDLPDNEKSTISSILEGLRPLKVQNILGDTFDLHGPSLESTTPLPWAYAIEVTYSDTDTFDSTPEKFKLFLTNRISGNQQLAGIPSRSLTVNLDQHWIDTLFPLTQAAGDQ